MVPNGSAYSNFPAFANNGTKTPPGGSTESAKYALGMVPADTFPAEWANYLFHGATAGITRLNQDTGSIKKEINSVLSNFNITPDATLNNQLLEALNKLKAEAALAAHPVHSLYWTASDDNPAVTFGGGTWVEIKDRFILACGDTYANGATGGKATVTLTVSQMPSHNHGGATGIESQGHTHSFDHWHNMEHTHGYTYAPANLDGVGTYISYISSYGATALLYNGAQGATTGGASSSYTTRAKTYGTGTDVTSTGGVSVNHTHSISSAGGDQEHENMPPYIAKHCWQRTA